MQVANLLRWTEDVRKEIAELEKKFKKICTPFKAKVTRLEKEKNRAVRLVQQGLNKGKKLLNRLEDEEDKIVSKFWVCGCRKMENSIHTKKTNYCPKCKKTRYDYDNDLSLKNIIAHYDPKKDKAVLKPYKLHHEQDPDYIGDTDCDPRYWDCNCNTLNFIHAVRKGGYCPKCKAVASLMPHSRVLEIIRYYDAKKDVACKTPRSLIGIGNT